MTFMTTEVVVKFALTWMSLTPGHWGWLLT